MLSRSCCDVACGSCRASHAITIIDNKLKLMSAIMFDVVTQVQGGSTHGGATYVSCATSRHDPESDTWTPLFRHSTYRN